MDIVTKQKINILIQLAESDKHFASIERALIFKIAQTKNFPSEAVHQLISHPEPIDSLGALSADQKFEYLLNRIELMLVDDKIFDREITFCKSIAIKLGFKQTVIEYLVDMRNTLSAATLKEATFASYY